MALAEENPSESVSGNPAAHHNFLLVRWWMTEKTSSTRVRKPDSVNKAQEQAWLPGVMKTQTMS